MILDWIDDHLGWIIGAGVVGIVGLIALAVYDECTAEKFYLRKDSWKCTSTKSRVVTGGYFVNNVWIPTSHVVTECVEYRHR